MWAEHCHRLEPLTLLSAHWQMPSLEHGWQIFFTHTEYIFSKVFVSSLRSVGPAFGGINSVFDKRVGMLFAARRNEDGNPDLKSGQVVHRRDLPCEIVFKFYILGTCITPIFY